MWDLKSNTDNFIPCILADLYSKYPMDQIYVGLGPAKDQLPSREWAKSSFMLPCTLRSFVVYTLAPASRSYPNHSLWHNGIVGSCSSLRRRQMSPVYFSSSFANREMAQNVVIDLR